jgi:nitrogen regulatory protein P-II 1
MRRVEALLPPAKLDEVKEALAEIGVHGMTLSETKVVDPAHGRREVYRGSAYVVDFVPKVKMELVVGDGIVSGVLVVLRKALGVEEAEETTVLLSEVAVVRFGRAGEASD